MKTPAVLFTCALALATYTLNARSSADLPDGWSISGEAPKLYAVDVDTSDSPSGKGSVKLRRTEISHPYGNAQMARSFPVDAYAGKRVLVTVRARFQDNTPIENQIFIGTDNDTHLEGLDLGGDTWNMYQVTASLPHNIKKLEVGVGLKGRGTAKVDGIELEVLGDAPPEQRVISTGNLKLITRGFDMERK